MQTLCRNRSLCLLFRKDTKPQLLNNNLLYLTKACSQIKASKLRHKPKAIPYIGGIAMVSCRCMNAWVELYRMAKKAI